jgi:hypothetical protein
MARKDQNDAGASQQGAIPQGRIRLNALHILIEGKPYQIVHMSIADVLIAGAPDWFAPRQKLDFSFVIDLPDRERVLPTYGIVIRNDAGGLEVRYTPPSLQWRDILAKLIQEQMRQQ